MSDGLDFCSHCGAMWDDNHERNGCPVMGTTARILGASDEEAEDHRKRHRRGLRETIRGVLSGRAGL
jgi:predicted  nucleic acid-binding Zn-ribbon protein